MALPGDVSKPLRGPTARKELVLAIRDPSDGIQETDWIEWKSAVDLNSKSWQGEIARQVLAMANRPRERAIRCVGGYGYVVLGVAPGQLHGVEVLDPADLESAIGRYTGRGDGPVWEPHYVAVDGVSVLVVEVDPPQRGHQAWPLRREYQDSNGKAIPRGRVFIRRHGMTVEASDSEIDELWRRAVAPVKELDVRLSWWTDPIAVTPVETRDDGAERWIEAERRRMHATFPAAAPAQSGVRGLTEADIFRPLLGIESRTSEAYLEEVESYLANVRPRLAGAALAAALKRGCGRVQFAVQNHTDHNFAALVVELHIPGPVRGAYDEDDIEGETMLLGAPELWGDSQRYRAGMRRPNVGPAVTPLRQGSINNSSSTTIRFPPVDLRPRHRHALAEVHLLVDATSAGGALKGHWTATSKSVSGVADGEIEILVNPLALDIVDLVRAR